MSLFEGTCKYCGSVQPIMAADQIDADEKVSDDCECGGAELDNKRKAMYKNLDAVCGEDAVKAGMAPLDEEQMEIAKYVGNAVLKGQLTSASLKINNTTLSFNIALDKLKVSRNKKIKFSREG